MRAGGRKRYGRAGTAVSILVIALGIGAAGYAWMRSVGRPATDDAVIDADIIHVAATVGGRIVEIPVAETMQVSAGDLLFQIDPVPYRLAVAQAEADLDLARASLETQRRLVATQRSTAAIAGDQVRRAAANLDLASRTVGRIRPLAAKGYVPRQQLDEAETAAGDAATSLLQAQEQEAAALRAIDTEAGAAAAVRAREAALAIARHALDQTAVRAPYPGRVVGLTVSAGEIVLPNQSLFNLVNTTEWFAVANLREFDLTAIADGDCATVYSLIDGSRPIAGKVQGIGAGVLDEELVNLPRSVPYVERSLNWVRVAQRFPVRIRLEEPPPALMRLGASAVVEVKHGAQCR